MMKKKTMKESAFDRASEIGLPHFASSVIRKEVDNASRFSEDEEDQITQGKL